MIYENQEQLQSACEEWQKRLRLSDWIVKAGFKRARDINEGCQAEVKWVIEKKMAIVSILDPVDYPPDSMLPQDMEVSLVHELLHLHFAAIGRFQDGSLEDISLEQAIDSIAMALVKAKRGE